MYMYFSKLRKQNAQTVLKKDYYANKKEKSKKLEF